jgi:UDP-GlcNAc:undecaprenyl-phosphate GlcNAc-1-phosphate transferase
VGLVVCTAVTLAPLGRRKAAEALAQLSPEDAAQAAGAARFDPLDRESERFDEAEPQKAASEKAS